VSSRIRERFRLSRGDTVGVVATGFAVKASLLRAGVAGLERLGFSPLLGDHVLEREGYFAGRDDRRAADLMKMITDPAVRAVWFARGGYGSSRLLDLLSWPTIKNNPKLLIGYSDLTALFAAATDLAGCRCLYGPVVTELGESESYNASCLRKLLAGRSYEMRFGARKVIAAGRAKGRLLGGNLSMLVHLCGTRFFPELRDGILFFEETGEEVYRIDRMLQQLKLAGALDRVAGVLVGEISTPARRRFPPDRSINKILREQLATLGIPVVTGLRAGHVNGKLTLPLGGRAELDTGAGKLRFLP
jgi:muramoyltetrapeptide carboxypeptidase